MDTHLCKSVSIDLFNLPPLPDERNKEESYMDMPYNYYIPGGKNSRLLDRTDRVEFNRETLDGNTGFQLKIPYLEDAFGTKYFVIDQVTGSMMGIYDDKVEQIDLKGQLKPFNINQLDSHVYHRSVKIGVRYILDSNRQNPRGFTYRPFIT